MVVPLGQETFVRTNGFEPRYNNEAVLKSAPLHWQPLHDTAHHSLHEPAALQSGVLFSSGEPPSRQANMAYTPSLSGEAPTHEPAAVKSRGIFAPMLQWPMHRPL